MGSEQLHWSRHERLVKAKHGHCKISLMYQLIVVQLRHFYAAILERTNGGVPEASLVLGVHKVSGLGDPILMRRGIVILQKGPTEFFFI